MNKKIFVLIVTYNGIRWIGKCLKSISNSNFNLTLLIIDNNSNDETIKFINKTYPNIKILQNKNNIGFGKANNMGIKYALDNGADFVILLNQDVYIEPNTIEQLISFYKEHPQFGIISPIHLNGDGKELDYNFSKCVKAQSINEIKQTQKKVVETDFVNAAAWLLPKQTVEKIGGFDPLFGHYGEDRDFCNRLRYHKFKIGVATNAFILHDRNYNGNNSFRKTKNLIFASGLAHLKNINQSILYNYLTWFLQRIKKMITWLLKINFNLFLTEISLVIKFLFMYKKIRSSRIHSKKSHLPYLSN